MNRSAFLDFTFDELIQKGKDAAEKYANAEPFPNGHFDDFFNAEKYPELRFKSTGIKALSADEFQLDGHLTIRDITKPISLHVELGGIAVDPYGNTKAGFEVTGKISRKEFDLKWNALTEAGGAVVADEVKIQANVQYAKVQPVAATAEVLEAVA